MSEIVTAVGPGFTVRLDGPPEGSPVLLLHGFPQDQTCWDDVVTRLVDRGCRCARFDQRGYDAAVRPIQVADYRLALMVEDVRAVLERLGWPTATVVGHDWGAMVAWALAMAHPDLVSRLVAVSVPHPAAFARALRDDPDQQRRSAYMGLFQVQDKAEDVLLAEGAAALRAVYAGLPRGQVDHYLSRFSDRGTLTAGLAWYRAMGLGADGPFGPVEVPTAFVWGSEDVAIGRTAAEGCAQFVSGTYDFVELTGVGHWVPELAPQSVVSAVMAP